MGLRVGKQNVISVCSIVSQVYIYYTKLNGEYAEAFIWIAL